MIKNLLLDKNHIQKSQIKVSEIAKLDFVGRFSINEIEIEILSLEQKQAKGQDYLEVFAKAWRNKKPLGFGDGSVEIERFRIFNPPILVDDENGDMVTEKIMPDGIRSVRKLKESPIEAIRQTLIHTINLVGKENTSIVLGKRGNTTDTFFATVDGKVSREGVDATWSTIVAGAGNTLDNTSVDYSAPILWTSNTNNQFQVLGRTIYIFDTSSIPDTDTITSATFSLYGNLKTIGVGWGISPSIDVYLATPASDAAIVATDFTQIGTTSQTGSALAYASFSTTGYNDFILNATGISNISKTGNTRFGTREATYDVPNVDPSATSWVGNKLSYMDSFSHNQTGTANDPKLVVTHTTPSTSNASFLMNFM